MTTNFVDFWALKKQVSLTAKNSALIKQRREGKAVWLPPLYYMSSTFKADIMFGREYTAPVVGQPPFHRWGCLQTTVDMRDPVTAEDIQKLSGLAQNRILEKLKKQHVNFAQFFVEAKQTADLLANTASSLASAVRKTKSGNIVGALKALGVGKNNRQRKRAADAIRRDGKRIAKSLGNEFVGANASQATKKAAGNWLAMQFGWMPLLSDLDGTAQLLADRSTEDPKRTRFNVRADVKINLADRSTLTYINNIYRTREVTGHVGMLIRIDYMFSNASLASASADGLTNPAALAWEELPFSFLADYCVGIGTYLEGLDSTLGKVFIGGSTTVYRKWTINAEQRYDSKTRVSGYRKEQQSLRAMERTVMSSFPDATLLALAIKNPLNSVKRVATSIALLRQAVRDF
jgi:hypothetical protein